MLGNSSLLIGLAGVLVTLAGLFLAWPKLKAEARKAEAEASRTEWQTLSDEIGRLEKKVTAQDNRIAELEQGHKDRAKREAGLERENKQLRQKVRKLEERVTGLEGIFKIAPIPPEMQAALDDLDRRTKASRS